MARKEIDPFNARDELEVFKDLQKTCCLPGYIHVIAYFCWRDNYIRFLGKSVTEKDMEHQYSHKKLIRSEISTLTGLLVKAEIDTDIPDPTTFQELINKTEELLHEIHMSMQKSWVAAIGAMAQNRDKEEHFSPFSTAEELREPIFYSGDSAHNFQYTEMSLKKYEMDEEWLRSHRGFSIKDACIVARAIGVLQTQKISDLQDLLKSVSPDKLTALSGFCFKVGELEPLTEIYPETIKSVLDAFSINLKNYNASFTSLSAFNEANAAPIIKSVDESYILLQHYSLLEALYETPFFWMIGDKSYAATASKHRGEFTEGFIATRLSLVFGPENVFRNVDIYKGRDRITEADVLVLYGARAIIVQAKSKRLTIEARKGNDLQLKNDFKKAIHDAYDQALLCSNALLGEECQFVLPSNQKIQIRKSIKEIYPICTVSDHFPALATQARQFLKIRTTETIQTPVVTDVFFIDVLTEILHTPLQFLNYLALRVRFDDQLLVNQENTVLGYHLSHNLWLESQYSMVNLADDFSAPLDIAMSARRLNLPGERTPKGILTRFNGTSIGKLISKFETSAIPELVGLGMIFLQLGSDSANHINKGLERLVRSAAIDGRNHDISLPSEVDKIGFTIHINSLPDDDAQKFLTYHCKIKKYDTKSDTWYGLLIEPGTGNIRGALALEEKWAVDAQIEEALAAWPKKSMVPVKTLSQSALSKKIGRNELCPCGSGKKYKKCCLDRN